MKYSEILGTIKVEDLLGRIMGRENFELEV